MKRLLLLFLLLYGSGVMAQPTSNSESEKKAIFHFYVNSDVFIFPGRGNEKLFNDVCEFIDAHRTLIENGSMPIEVFGYCGRGGSNAQRKYRVKQMSNSIKSEFICTEKAIESNFITKNSIMPYSQELPNVVVISFAIPVDDSKYEAQAKANAELLAADQAKEAESKRLATEHCTKEKIEAERLANEKKETAHLSTKTVEIERESFVFEQMCTTYKFALRTNLLHWLVATPNIGAEWRPNSTFSLIVDADWAPWHWNDKLNYYRMWNIQPQFRFYMGLKRAFYLGGEFHIGKLNWKPKTKGTQGDFIGGGLVGGYRIKLNRSLDMDFNLGVGYTFYDYDKYMDIDGFLFPYEKSLNKNYVGLTSAGVSLIWKLCK